MHVFCVGHKITPIISLPRIGRWVFLIQTDCFLCEVGNVYVISINARLQIFNLYLQPLDYAWAKNHDCFELVSSLNFPVSQFIVVQYLNIFKHSSLGTPYCLFTRYKTSVLDCVQ